MPATPVKLVGAARAEPAATPPPAPRGARAPRLSCVLPCLDEAQNLRLLLPQLREALRGCSPAWEVIVIDDGSRDDTAALMAHWSALPGFRCLQLSRNFGKEAALTAGLQAAHGEVVVLMDADLQHAPALIARMLERWRAGADVVYAVRANRDDEPWLKRLGARWFYGLVNGAGRVKLPADAGDFRLMDRQVVQALLALPERNRFMKGLYAWVGFRAEALPYTPATRARGKSKFRWLQLLRLSIDGITAFTTWPLRMVSVVGLAMAVPAFAYGAYEALSYLLYGNPVSGWTTLVVCLMFVAGLQLVSLGVLGAYIARIFEEVKARPLYVVRQESGQGLARHEA